MPSLSPLYAWPGFTIWPFRGAKPSVLPGIAQAPSVAFHLGVLTRMIPHKLDFGQSGGLAERVNQASLKGL